MWWTKPLVHPYMRIVGRYESFPHPNHLLVESESRRLSPIFPIFSYKSVRRYTHPSHFLLYIREVVYPSSHFSYISVSVLYRFLILQSLSLVWI